MPIFLLPKLSPNAPQPVKTGQWEYARDIDSFSIGLADDLIVAKNVKKTYSIDSIPDIWAKPLFFQMALYASLDDAHQNFDVGIHEKVKGEWRALLAMLALNEMRHLNIKVELVNLNLPGTTALENMLIRLAPNDSVSGNANDWNNIYVISYKDKPLAITSPTTLVATAADYSNSLKGMLTPPWSDDGHYLTDPISHLDRNGNELSGLYFWLNELKNNLHNYINPKNDTCLKLLKALNDYINDITKLAGGNLNQSTITAANLGMNIGIFQFLDKKVQAPPATPSSSAVRILVSKARAGAKPLLLVSPQMLQKISTSRGIPLTQLTVWAGITAVDINEQSLTSDKQMINGVPLVGAEWRRPEDFFTEHLLVLEGGNNFKINNATFNVINVRGSDVMMSNHNMSVVPPLQREILDYFEPNEIAKNLYIEKEGNYIKVQFTFTLSGKDGVNIDYTVEKSYRMNNENEVIYLSTTVPAIEIWPNFKRQGWKRYYLYYENPEAQNPSIHEAANDFFYVYPWAYGKDNITDDIPPQGLANLYTARLSEFPEALICTVRKTNDGIHSQNVEAGFILLVQPQTKPVVMGNSWKIGIDFGTSSTMIYYRNAQQAPQPLILNPNLFQVTNSGVIRTRTFQNFIRSKIKDHEDGSFLSIFQLLNNIMQDGLMPSIRPLQDGNVLWLESADGDDAEYFRDTSKQIDSNLKWKDDPFGNLKVEAYIKQICLQCLVEAAQNGVGNVSWNFSYPTAFSAHQQMTFGNTCNAAVADALQDSGFALGNIDHFAESQGSAYYFSNFGGFHLAGGAICLDIGAGTTDISIISGMPPRIVCHTSLKFAGNYLFKSIYKNYDVFCNSGANFGTMSSEQRNALIDADMRKYSHDYLNNLRIIAGQNKVQKVLKIAQFSMAGLLHYVGCLIKFLHEKNIYAEDYVPRIYIGGNGSRILSWICGGNFTNNNPYMSVFKDIFVAASDLTLKFGFNLVLSDTPKIEVACGMVEDIPFVAEVFFDPDAISAAIHGLPKGNDPIIADSVFAGDIFTLGDKEQDKTKFISAYDIRNGIKIDSANEIEIFANNFNSNRYIWDRGAPIRIDGDMLANVSLAVYGFYSQQFGKPAEDISVEPVFILELKKVVEMLS